MNNEEILNERQQERALELIDSNVSYVYNNVVHVTGVIKGTDIYLTQKNVEKLLAKSGKINGYKYPITDDLILIIGNI